MKQRVLTAVILLIIVITVSLLSMTETSIISDNIASYADDILSSSFTDDSAAKLSYELEEYWDKCYNKLSLYISHRELDNIGIQITSLSRYITLNNRDAAVLCCHRIVSSITQLSESMLPNLQNIL